MCGVKWQYLFTIEFSRINFKSTWVLSMSSQCLERQRNESLLSLDLEPRTLLGFIISLNINNIAFKCYFPIFHIKTLWPRMFKHLVQGYTIYRWQKLHSTLHMSCSKTSLLWKRKFRSKLKIIVSYEIKSCLDEIG